MWRDKLFQVLPQIEREYPTARFFVLKLEACNCELAELRSTLAWMNQSWQRLTQRKAWPALGWVKAVEVTRNKDGTASPYFYVLLMVKVGYFRHGYLSQERWAELWKSCLRVDYTPIVNVKIVRPNLAYSGGSEVCVDDLLAGQNLKYDSLARAVRDTLEYFVEPVEDLVADRDWLVELVTQLHNTNEIAVGGLLKDYLIDGLNDDYHASEDDLHVCLGWRERVKRYLKLKCESSGFTPEIVNKALIRSQGEILSH